MNSGSIKKIAASALNIDLGINKLNEISRLVYEISVIENIPPQDIFGNIRLKEIISNKLLGYHDKFIAVKDNLMARRYPKAFNQKDFRPYLCKLETIDEQNPPNNFNPKTVHVDKASNYIQILNNIKACYKGINVNFVDNIKKLFSEMEVPGSCKDLVITDEKWDMIKSCPCTGGAVHCNYHIINLGFGCPYDCSYCYLQHYKNTPGIILNPNIDDFLNKLDAYTNGKLLRFGTGEFTDSLALDHLTGHSVKLVEYFSRKNSLLELKTKSVNINNLIGLKHNGKTVVSWSLNPQKIVEREERFAASLEDRFSASRKCSSDGYLIGFHFDPVIFYSGWEQDYKNVVNRLFDNIKEPVWISIGSLRFNRSMKSEIEKRPDRPGYIYSEMVLGRDNKLRYYEALRRDIYSKMHRWIRERGPKVPVYLCMESKEMWINILNEERPFWLKK